MRILPLLGAAVAVTVAVGGGTVLRPDLAALLGGETPAPPTVAASPAANTTTNPAARQTVIAGPNPVTGQNGTPSYTIDRSLLGLPTAPVSPSVALPELVFSPPGPGSEAGITTRSRNTQFMTTTQWTAQPRVDGPVRRITTTSATGYVVVPAGAGELHVLCNNSVGNYYVDSHDGQWRIYTIDGSPSFDVSYRFVQFDRSPLSRQTTCQ